MVIFSQPFPTKNNMIRFLASLSILVLFSCGTTKRQPKEIQTPEAKLLSWDFSKERSYIYSYSQSVDGFNKMGKNDKGKISLITGVGKLTVDVKENNLADLSFIDMEMTMIMFDEDLNPSDTILHNAPINIVQDLKPDGSFADENTNILFKIIFPLPSQKLELNKSEEIPLKIPFNAMGNVLYSTGGNTLTFIRYEEMQGRNCAVFKGVIDVSDLDVPSKLEGEYKCNTTGLATYYFDAEHGYYVGVDVQMMMAVLMETTPDDEEVSGISMAIKNNNIIKIRLEKIEE